MGFSNIGEGRQTRQQPWGRRSERGLMKMARGEKPLELIAITQESTKQSINVTHHKLENSGNQESYWHTITGFKAIRW